MGFDLTSDAGTKLRFSGIGWAFYLNLAESYGWRPTGTLPPEGVAADQWSGCYDSNDGQHVRRDDAIALAVALSSALADPERKEEEKALAAKLTGDLSAMLRRPVSPVQPPEDDSLLRRARCVLRDGRLPY